MPILAEIAELEEAVAAVLDGAGDPLTRADVARVISDAVLAILDGYDLGELAELDLVQLVTEALAGALGPIEDELAADVAARTQEAVRLAAEFYSARGIDPTGVSDAVARSRVVQQLSQRFEKAMQSINSELMQGTVEVMRDAVLSGKIDRTQIATDVMERSEAAAHHARTQAQVTVSAFNQQYRNELAGQAGLGHWLYFGTLQLNSRAFCRVHLNKVFTMEQVASMDNGMLNPVSTFKGGYRCRHQFLPVDPEWDDELRAAVVPAEAGPAKVKLGRSSITVVGTPEAVQRLESQIGLAKQGYVYFEDARSNDSGYVAVSTEWWNAFLDARAGTKLRAEFDQEWAAAKETAEAGERPRLKAPDQKALTADERAALRRYTGSEYYDLNAALREGKTPSEELRALSTDLSSALGKLPAYEGTVHRGMAITKERFEGVAAAFEQPIVRFKAFTSTSRSERIASDFTAASHLHSVVLTITSKGGRPIADFSAFYREDEILFDRNTPFRVVSSERRGDDLHVTLEEL